MDIVKLHHRALEATTAIVANVNGAQFDMPTPCAEFDVRALLNHMIGGNWRFVKIAQGEPGEAVPSTGDFVHDDAIGPYGVSAAAVSEAWSDPALLAKVVHLPFGDFPGAFALGIHTVETIAHGWDLAKATSQPTEVEPELYEVAWQNSKDIDDSFRGPGLPFGPAVAVPPDASDTEKLMAWLGRQIYEPGPPS
ncbi:MAG: TIGR03086 family metal-binding protein [Acidimicrobiales bacterium]